MDGGFLSGLDLAHSMITHLSPLSFVIIGFFDGFFRFLSRLCPHVIVSSSKTVTVTIGSFPVAS